MSDLFKQIAPPDLSAVLREAIDGCKASLNAVNVGIIKSFDAAKQTATVQVALKMLKEQKPDGTKVIVEKPLLVDCPVVVLFGGSAYMTMPIAAGDACLLLFSDREIDNWLLSGEVSLPTSRRMHDLSDAIAIVGLRSFADSISGYLTNGIRLSMSPTVFELYQNTIKAVTTLFDITGNVKISGGLEVLGNVTGGADNSLTLDTNITVPAGRSLTVTDGATGTFTNSVTVVKGIVTGGT